MHTLDLLHIENYRSCKRCTVPLTDYTPLVGYNNVGKSTVLSAVQWFLRPKTLNASDYACDEPITIIGRISGLNDDVLDLLLEKHKNAIEPYCPEGVLWVKRTLSAGSKVETRVWEIDNHDMSVIPTKWRVVPTGIPEAINELFPEPIMIEAMQDVPEDLSKYKSGTTIQALLNELSVLILDDHKEELNAAISQIRDVIEIDGKRRSPKLDSFDADATQALGEFFPGLGVRMNMRAIDIKEFFKVGDLEIYEDGADAPRKMQSLGTGAQRSIQMALLKHLSILQANRNTGNEVRRRMLLVDEPELYLHPQGVEQVRTALKTLSRKGFQVVYATHSPQMIHRDDAPNTIIVRKTNSHGTNTPAPLSAAVTDAIEGASAQAHMLFELGRASEVFFSQSVLLFEGKTEARLLPLLYEKLYGRTPAADRIGMVELTGSNNIGPAMKVLQAMQIDCKALVDLDAGILHARKLGLEKDYCQHLLNDVKAIMRAMAIDSSITLKDDLPTKDPVSKAPASRTWARFAAVPESHPVVSSLAEELKELGVWMWKEGTIEDVLDIATKGEDAIQEMEAYIVQTDADAIRSTYPALCDYYDWVRAGRPSL